MRKQNWPELLVEFMNRDHTFDWSTCNCALFAADAVLELTGTDFGAPYRGPKTKRGMITKLKRVCGGNVEDAVTRELGAPLQNKLMAVRGDIVSCDFGEGPALGICLGAKAAFISDKDGLVYVPCELWIRAWKV